MRKQIAFATLTDAEINQIADWLRHHTYDAVRERVNKPRAEGGFGLAISRSPLERLHAKTNIVRKINDHLDSGEKLTVTKLDTIIAGESRPSEKVHDAIMEATWELATSGDNTPAQLLSLQRLADFPARAELREQREQRDAEMHHHRFVMALCKEARASQMQAHKIEMDQFREEITRERLDLAQRALALRALQAQTKNSPLCPDSLTFIHPLEPRPHTECLLQPPQPDILTQSVLENPKTPFLQ